MKNKTTLDVATRVCFSLLILFSATIIIRFLTRQILVEQLGWDNIFTQTVFLGDGFMGDMPGIPNEDGEILVEIDWESRYPFNVNGDDKTNKSTNRPEIFDKYISMIAIIEEKINRYTSDFLLGHLQLTKIGRQYNSLIGYSTMPMNDDNYSVIVLNNGYMTYCEPAVEDDDLEILADNVSGFADHLNEIGIYFVYANAGSKVCPSDKQLPPGVVENTNENADKLIDLLEDKNVDVLDYRPLQEADFKDWYDTYYITDHHWKNSTGLWAAGVLAEHLNSHAGFDFDPKYFDRDMYSIETKNDYFLGGQGRSLTTAVAALEPFDKILPAFETDFSIQIPTRGIDKRGDYSETLFNEKFYDSIADYSIKDFETKTDTYHSTAWINDALGVVQNHLSEDNDGKRILMIQDSFGWYLSTYLATDIPKIDLLNPTAFDGSLRAYISETKPDAVVLLLCEQNISAIGSEEYAAHTHYFDLR